MKSKVKQLEKSQVEITIEVSVEEIQPYLVKSAEKLSKEMKIEGFRPGKAPYEIVKQKVGEMALYQEALDDIISKTYFDSLKEHKIVSIGQPKVDIEKLAPGNSLVFKAVVSVLPEVKVGDYKSIKLEKNKVEISQEQIEKVITDIQKMRAKDKPVERVAKQGDKLEIDFDVFQDKVPIENGAQKNYPITIGENKFIPGFEENLIGMKAGEEKEFELKFPEKYYQKNLAGKKSEFKVKVNKVFEIEVPEINDAFVKEVSGDKFKTLKELHDNVKENLENEAKMKEDQRLEIEMLDKIVDISEFEDIPDLLIENEIKKMINEIEINISQQGLKFDDYLTHIKKTKEDLGKEFRTPAEKRVKTAILTRKIYLEQKFEVRDDEIEKEIEVLLKQYGDNPEAKKQLESETYRDYLHNTIGNRKVIEYLKKEIIK